MREYSSPACVQDEITKIRQENVAVAAARVAAGLDTSPLLGVCLNPGDDRWTARMKHSGNVNHHYLGRFDREADAGHAVDLFLCDVLNRPEDVNYDEAGVRTGNDPRRLQVAAGTANLVGDAKRASKLKGVGKNGDSFRANLRIPLCLYRVDVNGKEILSLPLPVCPTVAAGRVCACKTHQKFYPNVPTEIEAAKVYDSMVRHYGLDKPPHNKPTNYRIE